MNDTFIDQARAGVVAEIGNMIRATMRGLEAEPDSTKLWSELQQFFLSQCFSQDEAEVTSGILAETLIMLARGTSDPRELRDDKWTVVALTETLRRLRWRLRATPYYWLADEEISANSVSVPDERWDRWSPR